MEHSRATPHHVLDTPQELGERVAAIVLERIARANASGARFLLGCPTGRTPRPVYAAMARRLADAPQDLGRVVLVMMDEYLVESAGRLEYAAPASEWSCHHFAQAELVGPLNEVLQPAWRLSASNLWFPDPRGPAAYEARIADAGGIDLFILASGASDGHVAFNPPGSPRESRTRIVPLSESTRRDNLATFPAFRTLDAVPHHGVSVGIATIASAREAMLLLWGRGKHASFERVMRARSYEPDWPATLIHECPAGEILSDRDASTGGGA